MLTSLPKSRRLPLAVLLLILSATARAASPAVTTPIMLAYIGNLQNSAWLGARLGIEDANAEGAFLRLHFDLKALKASTLNSRTASAYTALLVAGNAATVRRIAAIAPHRAIFNLSADDNSLRSGCLGNVLSVAPSARMIRDAVSQWRKLHPGTTVEVKAWDPTAANYAGHDLNARFRRHFRRSMDDLAWAGWAAAAMVGDAVARTGSADPRDLLDNLKDQESFDGEKGVELSFLSTGQLRQPLMLIDGNKPGGEVPVTGVVEPEGRNSPGPARCGK